MAQENKKGFTVISDIQADTVVAAITDGNLVKACVSGETIEVLDVYRTLVRSLAESLAGAVKEEKQDRTEKIVIEILLVNTIKGALEYFVGKEEEEKQ